MNQNLTPWTTDTDGERVYVFDSKRHNIYDDPLTPNNENRAKLIAAAPDLLEALEAIVAREHGEYDHPALVKFGLLSTNNRDVLRIAETALAKVRP